MTSSRPNPVAWLVTAALTLSLTLCGSGHALSRTQQPQEGAPPPGGENLSGESYAIETPQQLQQLVAPIALYPDSLVASILAASSYPSQIAEANEWLAPRRNLPPQELAAEADKQPWDASVKALLPFPPVLQNLASNLSWTSELGDAYYNQLADVMEAVQQLRRQAKKAGTLKSNDKIKVTERNGYISIDPVNPQQIVYVPAYDPWVVYGYPIPPWPGWVSVPGIWWDGPGIYLGLGFAIGPFWGFGWGWPVWRVDWFHHGLFFHGAPYFARGPAFFNRYYYYRGRPGFARPLPFDRRFSRGFVAPRPGIRSGPFSGFNHGGTIRNFSARGQGSIGGGFRGGGFRAGGFRGGGGRR
jgi:hypothetical protein